MDASSDLDTRWSKLPATCPACGNRGAFFVDAAHAGVLERGVPLLWTCPSPGCDQVVEFAAVDPVRRPDGPVVLPRGSRRPTRWGRP